MASDGKKRLHFEVRIDAPVARVWQVMLDQDSYRAWTAEFCEGSYYEGGWEKGQEIRFLTPSGEGMVGRIADNRRHEFVSIEHLGMIDAAGKVDTDSEKVRAWTPAFENYRFAPEGGGTRLDVEMDTVPSYEQFMQDTWPKALAKLKALCEAPG